MSVVSPSVNFNFAVPAVGGDFNIWGNRINAILADDGPGSIDSILFDVKNKAEAALAAAGGTITGDLTLSGAGTRKLAVLSTDGGSVVDVSRGSTSARSQLRLRHNQVNRWNLTLSANAAGNLEFRRFDDSGTDQGAAMVLNRATGGITFSTPISGNGSGLTNLDASSLTTGTLSGARFPFTLVGPARYRAAVGGGVSDPPFSFENDIDTGMYRSGENIISFSAGGGAAASISATAVSCLGATGFVGVGAQLTALNASALSSGTVPVARLPNLSASQTTSGVFDTARIPNLPADRITTGQFDNARLPDTINQTTIQASGSLQVGGGTAVTFIRLASHVTTSVLIDDHSSFTETQAVTGAQVGDKVFVTTQPGDIDERFFLVNGVVTSPGTVTLHYVNTSGSQQSANGLDVNILVVRP